MTTDSEQTLQIMFVRRKKNYTAMMLLKQRASVLIEADRTLNPLVVDTFTLDSP